jgi:hypothetical protein
MNILVTPNILINYLLLKDEAGTQGIYCHFLKNVIKTVERSTGRIYMTEIDHQIVAIYIDFLLKILKSTSASVEEVKLVQKYLCLVEQIPVTNNILEIASRYSSKINPSDAIRLATAISNKISESDIEIENIVTWEPSHYCHNHSDFLFVRDNGYAEIIVDTSEYFDDKTDESRLIEVRQRVCTPSSYISNGQNSIINQPKRYKFNLINLKITSEIEEIVLNNTTKIQQNNIVTVIVECYDSQLGRRYQLENPVSKESKIGPISALFLAIYLSVKKISRQFSIPPHYLNTIDRSLVKDIIFGVNPLKENNKEIYADIYLRNTNIQASVVATNLLWATGKSYIQVINQCIEN